MRLLLFFKNDVMYWLDQNNTNLDSKEKLLRAAFILFAENGFNGTSTRSLCKMADVNISAIPYYFNSKEGLYNALILEISHYLNQRVAVNLENVYNEEELTPEIALNFLELFINNFIEFAFDKNVSNNMGLLITREHINPSEAYDILYENLFKHVFKVLCKLISVLTNKNEDDQNVIISVNSILGQILSFKLLKHTLIRVLDVDEIETKHIESAKAIVIFQVKAIIMSAGGNL